MKIIICFSFVTLFLVIKLFSIFAAFLTSNIYELVGNIFCFIFVTRSAQCQQNLHFIFVKFNSPYVTIFRTHCNHKMIYTEHFESCSLIFFSIESENFSLRTCVSRTVMMLRLHRCSSICNSQDNNFIFPSTAVSIILSIQKTWSCIVEAVGP